MENEKFYDIISKHVIEVPIIQREYAQGRKLPRVTAIRKRFVKDLVNSIYLGEEMHLGFIYGKIEGKDKQRQMRANRDAVNSILEAVKTYASDLDLTLNAHLKDEQDINVIQSQLKFIPLDGQQRLTTLYLLHWYLHIKGAISSSKQWLKNFGYANRKSTIDFLKVINQTNNIDAIRKRLSGNRSIKEVIQASGFYLNKWNRDSSVLGILEMLNAFESEFDTDYEFSNIQLDVLPFRFDFMNLDQLNQTNELYVKMNSRGKQLSNYEHFKSWLQNEYAHKKDDEWFKEFWRKLDNDWLNYFWKKIDGEFEKLDDFYFNFLKHLALMNTIATNRDLPEESLKYLIQSTRNSTYDRKKLTYIPFDKFHITWNEPKNSEFSKTDRKLRNSCFLFNKESLKFIEESFETIIALETGKLEFNQLSNIFSKTFIQDVVSNQYTRDNSFTPSQPDSVFYYATLIFFNNYRNEKIKLSDVHQLRTIRNLIYNTEIQNPKNFIDALRQVKYLSSFDDFLSASVTDKNVTSFFLNDQFEEELLKKELKAKNKEWIETIDKVENHFYFMGQVQFLLDFSKSENGEFNLEKFKIYSNTCGELFSKEVRESKFKVIQRALLCKGDYLPASGNKYTFFNNRGASLRNRNENWRRIFKEKEDNLLKTLLDDLIELKNVSEKTLTEYIKNQIHIINLDKWHWRRLFIEYPKAISYCNQDLISWNGENDIRLLPGKIVGGYHTELRSYCFFLEHSESESGETSVFNPFNIFWHFEMQNYDSHPGCYLSGLEFDEKSYRLDIKYSKNGGSFELCFFNDVEEIEDRNIDKTLVNVLEKQHFSFDDNEKYFFKEVDDLLIFDEIKSLCNDLIIKL
ncbi:Protein of unknown function DUF262 [Maribacter dokdonensis]|uniref:GmrSD restriction endonuclease domain-containing protein n=1 Tax=Maribacter dokdonensis TaxID=320912 RepID=UPI001B1C51F1|nr:DUF262 domain-containing protein [Maribacter dokdonensis]CAG2534038.1 Protein of unknown function DUF262 [Maribacter dokdonensis]